MTIIQLKSHEYICCLIYNKILIYLPIDKIKIKILHQYVMPLSLSYLLIFGHSRHAAFVFFKLIYVY